MSGDYSVHQHSISNSFKGAAISAQTTGYAQATPEVFTQPALERLGFIAMRARETADLIGRFQCRLAGGPSTLNPPPNEPANAQALPSGLNELLDFVENALVANHSTLSDVAGGF